MKIAGIAVVILALVIGIVPQFTDCQSQGRMIELPNGKLLSMKCHWTALAELALAVPTAMMGGLLAFSKRKESRNSLAILGTALGLLAVMIPTALIGVCASPDMLCAMIMKPALILSGILISAISLVSLVSSWGSPELAV